MDTGSKAMKRVLAHADRLGMAVEHSGGGMSRTTWVLVGDDARDDKTREVICRLLALGFAHWLGRGFWK